jgi:hypothetical protein
MTGDPLRSHRPSGVQFTSTGPQGHRARMRARLLAEADALADYEVLEMLLFLGIPRRDTKPFAKGLIIRFGSLAAVVTASPEELESAGLNAESVTALKLVVEAADQLAAAESIDRPVLNNLDRLAAYLDPATRSQRPAHLAVLYLAKSDRFQWQAYVVVTVVLGQTACSISRPAQHTQQAELIGGTLGVVEHEMAEERESPGAVVRQPQHDIGPGYTWPTLEVRGGDRPQHLHTLHSREVLDFGEADGIAAPTVINAVPKRHDDQAA